MTINSHSEMIVTESVSSTVEFRHTQPVVRAANTPPLACGSQLWLVPFVMVALIVFAPIWILIAIVWALLHSRRAWQEIAGYSRGKVNK